MNDKPSPRAFYEADSLSTEIYDALAAGIIAGSSVEGDIDFYRRLAGETGGPILDVGCGTARVAAALTTGDFRGGSPASGREQVWVLRRGDA